MLDTGALSTQLRLAADALTRRQTQRSAAAAAALADARACDATWRTDLPRIRAAASSWLVAHSEEPPATAHALPPLPDAYFVVATDGSQIAADRHDGFDDCLLLQIGLVRIEYGNGRRARLDREAHLLLRDDDEDGFGEAQIAARRYARELRALDTLIRSADDALPGIALVDGSLIAWHLDLERDRTGAAEDALAALLETLETARRHRTPVAGYISQPRSRDVVHALRVRRCPDQPRDCPQPRTTCDCSGLSATDDAGLFARLLAPGERSPVFGARGQTMGYSHILPRYGDHWIRFFYVNTGVEIARIELPEWAAEDPTLLDRVHAVACDQARKGQGYPVAAAEAHELAVLRPEDRERFLRALERAVIAAGGAPQPSRKARAKRTRSV